MYEISNAEFDVIEVLWRKQPLSANDVVNELAQSKSWHEKTVKTLLNRLVKKEIVGFSKDGRRYLYYPLVSKEEYTSVASKRFINKLFSGRLAPLVSGFSQYKKLSQEDIDELKQVINDWEKTDD